MAVTAAVGVAVIYLPQPIQTLVAAEFGVSVELAGAAAVAVQAGYAAGIVLLVSLGDRIPARRQVSVQLVVTAAAVLAAAAAPSFAVYLVAVLVAGAAATIGQIVVSAALRIAPPESRARTAAVLVGSFLIGLFLVRSLLGALAEQYGWRAVLVGFAVLALACLPLTLRFAPRELSGTPPRYSRILASIPRIARASGALRLMTAIHTLAFGAFITAWSTITVYAVQGLGLDVGAAALLGLAGLTGGVVTMLTARLHPRVGPRRALLISLCSASAGALLLAGASMWLPAVIPALFLVSFGMSSSQVSTQARALASVAPEESGRANTVFMAVTFFGGAVVTAIAQWLYGWSGYGVVGALTAVLALAALTLAVVAIRTKTI
jgi:predicted MFS family arabinose efflux permease